MGRPIPWCYYCDEEFDTEQERDEHEQKVHGDEFIKYRGPSLDEL